jgi:hypothetical protein
MVPVNAYLSFKKVSRTPNDIKPVATGSSSAGVTFAVAVTEGDDERPALFLKMFPPEAPEGVLLRVDFSRLVDSLIAGEGAQSERWEPLKQDGAKPTIWGNTLVSAGVYDVKEGVKHISYHRRDRAPVRDWRIGQRIKNQLAGPEWEAVELYPAESRVVDTSNEYHLFAFDGDLPFGFSYEERGTQDQIDETWEGPTEGPVQRDDPGADVSSFQPVNWKKIYTSQRVPE